MEGLGGKGGEGKCGIASKTVAHGRGAKPGQRRRTAGRSWSRLPQRRAAAPVPTAKHRWSCLGQRQPSDFENPVHDAPAVAWLANYKATRCFVPHGVLIRGRMTLHLATLAD